MQILHALTAGDDETIANGGLADAEARLGFSKHRIVAAHTQATHHTIPQATLHLIIEVTSAHDAVPGLHGTVEGGSFADVNGSIDLQYQLPGVILARDAIRKDLGQAV